MDNTIAIQFLCLGGGVRSFTSKDGRQFTRLSLMGMVTDCLGNSFPATASLGFGGSANAVPPKNKSVVLYATDINFRNAMAEVTFLDYELQK